MGKPGRLKGAITAPPPVAIMSDNVEIRLRLSQIGVTQGPEDLSRNQVKMPEVTIVYWRDIPAQVIVGKGRTGSKVKLTERFEQAIDRCAMKIGARDSDAYLAEWRKAPPYEEAGDPAEVAARVAAQIETTYDTERLKTLINAEGWAQA